MLEGERNDALEAVVLADDEVSRRHAAVRASADGLEVSDLGSSNGTSVNGQRLDAPRQLRDGDEIRIGATTITVEVPTPPGRADAIPTLVVKSGPREGERLPVAGTLTFGRENADVVIDEPEVSRRHALVRAIDGTLEISDVGSANGTFVNDERIEAVTTLEQGDSIRVGGTTFEVKLGEPGRRTTVAAPGPPATVVNPSRHDGETPGSSGG